MASARHQKIEAATARLMETEQTREEEEAAQHSGREEMNRYRNIPGRAAPSKATPTTVCQKCLKKDSYECTTQLQERPYGARPSRTQQLSNPRLRPQLSTEVPNDLLRTKGVADEQLRRAKEKRARLNPSRSPDRESDYGDAAPGSRKRASLPGPAFVPLPEDRGQRQMGLVKSPIPLIDDQEAVDVDMMITTLVGIGGLVIQILLSHTGATTGLDPETTYHAVAGAHTGNGKDLLTMITGMVRQVRVIGHKVVPMSKGSLCGIILRLDREA
ncbi:hypothetical protein GTR04_5609 [Trichophyton interdigitale]|nr:hypothetical protein GTR04_5609 [Trichophyton interdigitale]